MDGSTSLEAGCLSASQEIPCIVWNPQVHFRVHNSVPLSVSSALISSAPVLIFQLASSFHFSAPKMYAQYLLSSTNREAAYYAILLVRTPLERSSVRFQVGRLLFSRLQINTCMCGQYGWFIRITCEGTVSLAFTRKFLV